MPAKKSTKISFKTSKEPQASEYKLFENNLLSDHSQVASTETILMTNVLRSGYFTQHSFLNYKLPE